MPDVDLSRSVQQLEDDDWGEPVPGATHLLTTVLGLRRNPLAELAVEDLRIMLGQGVGLPFLVPLALDLLAADPLAEGDYYRGDLLSVVLRRFSEWEREVPDARARVTAIARRVDLEDPEIPSSVRDRVSGFLAGG